MICLFGKGVFGPTKPFNPTRLKDTIREGSNLAPEQYILIILIIVHGIVGIFWLMLMSCLEKKITCLYKCIKPIFKLGIMAWLLIIL